MTEAEFWQIAEAKDPLASSDAIAADLRAKLEPLDDQSLADFDKFFNQRMRLCFTWDLWGAAFVIAGCDSEFAFSEFRSWLISRGQNIFSAALQNPDTIADSDIVPYLDEHPNPYLDDYDLIAGLIYEERTGNELAFVPSGQNEPKGKRFKDKPKLLKGQYPRLFARYWPT
jgi:hypothetical protein